MFNRREFLGASAGLVAAGFSGVTSAQSPPPQKKVAFIGTEVRRHSHAQHFLDRLTLGYTWGGQWRPSRVQVASVYIDQFPEGDLAKGRIARHQLRQCPSIAEALTLGTDRLAVDGVVIIAEHGDYPRNEKRQKLYPRYSWFKEVVKVFEQTGQSAPVFNDKHLSTEWSQCAEMVEDSRRLGFPFLAGSSLPVTWRLPAIDMPYGAPLQESVCVAYGGIDSYDFHALETAQCMSERRRGGEVGIREVHALTDETLYDELASADRKVTRELFVAALTRSHNLPVTGGYPTDRVSFAWARDALPKITGYFIEHRDGFRTAIFMTGIRDFNYAGKRSDTGDVVSCQMYLPMPGHGSTTADFFNPLSSHIEDLVLKNATPYPVERTLLTSGMVIGGVNSIFNGNQPFATPEMAVTYQAPRQSTFWRV